MGKKHREKEEERQPFTWEEKQLMLNRSNSKCAHCNRKLDIGQMTVEHIIPISKGGTNDTDNLVALCYECNNEKSNLICEPEYYFKHLNKSEMKKVKKYTDDYIKRVNWLSFRNIAPYDRFMVHSAVMVNVGDMVKLLPTQILCTLAKINDYDDDLSYIHEHIQKWNKEHDVDLIGDELDIYIDEVAKEGGFYYLGDLKENCCLLPFRVKYGEIELSSGYVENHYYFSIMNPIHDITNKNQCISLANLTYELIDGLINKAKASNVNTIPVVIQSYSGDPWYHVTLNNMLFNDNCPYGVYPLGKMDRHIQEFLDWSDEGEFIETKILYNDSRHFKILDSLGNDKESRSIITSEELNKFDRFIQKFCMTNNYFY